jgi:rod shape-determining protein MreC
VERTSSTTTAAIVAVVLIVVSFLVSQTPLIRPVRGFFAGVLAPVESGFANISEAVSSMIQGGRDLEQVREENRQLRVQVDQLTVDNLHLKEAEAENAQLRELLKFRQKNPSYAIVGAEVIGRAINWSSSNLMQELTIDLGERDDIRTNMTVVTDRGLVGRILEVHPSSSTVLLITDSRSSVAAVLQRNRLAGLVEGRPGGRLVMTGIRPDQTVAEGDIVETSGMGGNFPKGLIIGQVTRVIRSDVGMFQEAEIAPTVSLGNLERVLVISAFEPVATPAAK